MENIIVSATTIPERIILLPRFLSSLEKQTIKPSKIYIQIPKKSRKGVDYDINKIEQLVMQIEGINVIINIVDIDEGPITKLVPVLDLEKNPNTIIILMDEDVIYGENIIETLLKYKNLGAVGFAGRKFNSKNKILHFIINNSKNKIDTVDFLETYHGVLYKRSLFPSYTNFIKWMHKLPKVCIYNDDIVIGAWLDQVGKFRYIIPSNNVRIIHDASNLPELNKENLKGRNEMIFLMLCNGNHFKLSLGKIKKSNYYTVIYTLILIFVFIILFIYLFNIISKKNLNP